MLYVEYGDDDKGPKCLEKGEGVSRHVICCGDSLCCNILVQTSCGSVTAQNKIYNGVVLLAILNAHYQSYIYMVIVQSQANFQKIGSQYFSFSHGALLPEIDLIN